MASLQHKLRERDPAPAPYSIESSHLAQALAREHHRLHAARKSALAACAQPAPSLRRRQLRWTEPRPASRMILT
jgi:hypothetical protein